MFVLDPYAARSCPLKVHNAFHPGLVRPDAAPPQRLPGGQEFSASVLDRVAAGRASVADLRNLTGEPSEVQEAACLAAMAAGTEVVIGGLLPRDRDAHRSGRPDLLVRDGSGYVPGIVKYQRVVDVRRDDLPATFSALADLPDRVVATGWRYRWHWRWQNSLQLAHLWRLLGATGHQAERPWGLVVGNDEIEGEGIRATWLDLTEPAVPPAPGQVVDPAEATGADPVAPVSPLERYDHEFALRVGLAELASAAEPDDPPLLRPVVSFECTHCAWWPVCREQLDDDDISLRISKSPLDTHEITVLREAGIETVHQLATRDIDALLPDYLPRVAHRPGAEDRLRLAQRRSRLLLDGVQLQRTTSGPIPLPQAPLEIDIDVETSRDDRVYLWGFWVARGDEGGSYHAFSSFSDLDDAGELALARSAMAWLRAQVDGSDALVFHYSDYEVVRLRRLAPADDEVMQWAVRFAEDCFLDLFPAVRQHFFGTNGLGLKVVASAGAGFHWRDEDPGGLNSMRWFDDAVHAPSETAREQARTRVLEYNEDDVRATWHLRRWLRELA
ncbi:MAG: TM0106 family RecB-like putative nuclease [Propionicimonas sp.]|uniref:TM0106 family RecB-like putative nuclease n=1 Tax=Propionicimonas sp. TaxID=1955623 RepID=UPI003D127252